MAECCGFAVERKGAGAGGNYSVAFKSGCVASERERTWVSGKGKTTTDGGSVAGEREDARLSLDALGVGQASRVTCEAECTSGCIEVATNAERCGAAS